MYALWTFLAIISAAAVVRLVVNYQTRLRDRQFELDQDAFSSCRRGFSGSAHGHPHKLTLSEIILGAVLSLVIIIPLVGAIASSISVKSQLTKHEYHNGYEQRAVHRKITCHRDGSCRYTYSCDPYTVVKTRTVTDAEGNTRTETYTDTEYHSCPYTDEEWVFSVETSLDTIDMGHVLPEKPTSRYWRKPGFLRGGEKIPHRLIENAGYPAEWLDAKKRLDAGMPRGVTRVANYENPLLASDQTIFERYSGEIKTYRKKGLLPDPAKGTGPYMSADKVHVVGKPQGVNEKKLRKRVMAVNGRLGGFASNNKRGDLHLVIVDARDVSRSESQAYLDALMAWWQAPEHGRDQIAKNAIVVLVGTEDGKVVWSKGDTGMPTGNEAMEQALSTDLEGLDVAADSLIGKQVPVSAGKSPKFEGEGIAHIIFETHPFERACMDCKDKGESATAGYDYLRGDVRPTRGAMITAGAFSFLIAVGMWLGLAFTNLYTIPGLGPVLQRIDELIDRSRQ